jgi:hypothetical protein
MAQDPESNEERNEGGVDLSHDLDLAPLFTSTGVDAEMEATNIHRMLKSSGIPSVLNGTSTMPVFEFQVLVPRTKLEEAERRLRDAREAGPDAALEAEQEFEQGR